MLAQQLGLERVSWPRTDEIELEGLDQVMTHFYGRGSLRHITALRRVAVKSSACAFAPWVDRRVSSVQLLRARRLVRANERALRPERHPSIESATASSPLFHLLQIRSREGTESQSGDRSNRRRRELPDPLLREVRAGGKCRPTVHLDHGNGCTFELG